MQLPGLRMWGRRRTLSSDFAQMDLKYHANEIEPFVPEAGFHNPNYIGEKKIIWIPVATGEKLAAMLANGHLIRIPSRRSSRS